MKQLYFLHIPKTAGKFVGACVKKALENTDKRFYISTHYPNDFDISNKSYISGHFGTYPIDKVPSIDVACILRNPIDARISYFNFIYKDQLINRPEYLAIDSYLDKLKFYLFEDKNYLMHNNYQARFICNSADARSFNAKGFYEEYGKDLIASTGFDKGKAFTWFVNNENTSLEYAIKQIDSFKIVHTTERLDWFMAKLNNWFNKNHEISIEYDLSILVNDSSTVVDGISYTTNVLKSMLSEEDKDRVLKLNDIDYSLYCKVRSREIEWQIAGKPYTKILQKI